MGTLFRCRYLTGINHMPEPRCKKNRSGLYLLPPSHFFQSLTEQSNTRVSFIPTTVGMSVHGKLLCSLWILQQGRLSPALDDFPPPCSCQTMKGSQQDAGQPLMSAGHRSRPPLGLKTVQRSKYRLGRCTSLLVYL